MSLSEVNRLEVKVKLSATHTKCQISRINGAGCNGQQLWHMAGIRKQQQSTKSSATA